jgi:hypothetical protein
MQRERHVNAMTVEGAVAIAEGYSGTRQEAHGAAHP